MTSAVETENNMANKKNKRAVMYSGIIPVAQKLIVTRERAAALDSSGENESGGNNRISAAPTKLSVDITVFILALKKFNLLPLPYQSMILLKRQKDIQLKKNDSHYKYLLALTSIQIYKRLSLEENEPLIQTDRHSTQIVSNNHNTYNLYTRLLCTTNILVFQGKVLAEPVQK